MKTAIIGAGAMGCLFAARLHAAGNEVLLIEKNQKTVEAINAKGLRIEGEPGVQKVPVLDPDAVSGFASELCIVLVKSYSTEKAARDMASCVGSDTVVLTLQNGMGNVEALQSFFGKDRVIGGATSQGATLIESGVVRHAGKGPAIIGEPSGKVTERAKRIAAMFMESGLESEVTGNLPGLLWGKLIINAGINPLTAILDVKNGALLRIGDATEIMRMAVEEAALAARAHGVDIGFADPVAKVEEVTRLTSENVSSMRQDVLSGRETEIESITGAVVRAAAEAGIPAPVNEMLLHLVRAITQRNQSEL